MTIPRPALPDTVIRFQNQPSPRILPAAADTVAIPLIHDWGPILADAPGDSGVEGGLQEVTSFDGWIGLFGDSDTAGRTAVGGCFAGVGQAGLAGAGAVLVARMAGSSVAAATVTLADRAAANALTLTGRYKGSRGNRISVIIDTDPSNAANDRLRVLLDGAVRETYSYAQTDVISLVAAINTASSLVRATNLEVAPARLAATAGTPLAGGDDGATLLSTDHLAALAALEQKTHLYAILSPYDLTDGSILASYVSWIDTQDQASRPVRLVIGGAAGESYASAQTRSSTCNDPHVVNVGVGTWHDDLLDKDLSTSQLAPRVAGILAAKGQSHALTATELGGIHPVGSTAPSYQDAVSAVKNGVVVLVPADSPDADVKIAEGVTTYTTRTDPTRPYDVFSDARLVGVMDNYVRRIRAWGNKNVIGDVPVNDDTRNALYAEARAAEDDLLTAGLILPGDDVQIPIPWVNVTDTDNDPGLRDTLPYTFGWQFARTANAIMGQGTVL